MRADIGTLLQSKHTILGKNKRLINDWNSYSDALIFVGADS